MSQPARDASTGIRSAAALLLLAGCPLAAAASGQAAPAPAAQSAQATPQRPRLVLFVSVDQMRSDYLPRYEALFRGGFRRLLDQGAFFTNARYRHANNETGPGHSVMLSGRDPRSSGIVANEWWDGTLRRLVNVVDDPVQQPLGGAGRAASPAHFNGFTVGDALKAESPRSRVVAASLKDRSAVLLGGRRADAAYWFESLEGRFITSSYYAAAVPEWLAAWNDRRLPDAYAGRRWERLLAAAEYERRAGPDDVASERGGGGNVFPHRLPGSRDRVLYEELRRTPFGDELLLEFALAAIEAHGLGHGPATDMLAVGFSATDGVGHSYGPDSQEQMDQLLRLDLLLGRLFDALDARVGRDGWLFAMSADHGVMPLPELLQERGTPARRVPPQALADPVDRALQARFPGAPALVAQREGPHVYLDLDAIERHGLRRADVEATVAQALLASGIVEHVYRDADMLGDAPAADPAFELFQRAYFAPRSPQLIVRLRPYVYLSSYPGGTGHGTHHDYDRHVPVVFMGPGVRPGRYPGECGPEEIAPSLAALLGLDYPLQDARRVLAEMFSETAAAGRAVGRAGR